MTTQKGCPFCDSGDVGVVEEENRYDRTKPWIGVCFDCDAQSSPARTRAKALTNWNKRPKAKP